MEPVTGRPSEHRTEHSGAARSDEPVEVVGAPIPDVMATGADAVAGMTAGWLDHPLKRMIDLAVAGPAFLVALPVMLLIAVATRLDSPGTALFRQARVGRGGRSFLPKQRSDSGPAFEAYTAAPPGLTGLWQVSGRSRLSLLDRVECDERYRRSCSLGLDLRILLRTVVVVASRDGAW